MMFSRVKKEVERYIIGKKRLKVITFSRAPEAE